MFTKIKNREKIVKKIDFLYLFCIKNCVQTP